MATPFIDAIVCTVKRLQFPHGIRELVRLRGGYESFKGPGLIQFWVDWKPTDATPMCRDEHVGFVVSADDVTGLLSDEKIEDGEDRVVRLLWALISEAAYRLVGMLPENLLVEEAA